jgi:hypothetical protein
LHKYSKRTKFSSDSHLLIYIFTLNNPDFYSLLYPYITIPPPPSSSVTVYPHSFLLSHFQSCCVRAHTETHLVRF